MDTFLCVIICEFLGILVLIIEKACGILSWNWLWVLSPIWVPAIIIALILSLSKGVSNEK